MWLIQIKNGNSQWRFKGFVRIERAMKKEK